MIPTIVLFGVEKGVTPDYPVTDKSIADAKWVQALERALFEQQNPYTRISEDGRIEVIGVRLPKQEEAR